MRTVVAVDHQVGTVRQYVVRTTLTDSATLSGMTNTERVWKPGTATIIGDSEFILSLPERACGCHPAMPVERTPAGWACKGCGVPA